MIKKVQHIEKWDQPEPHPTVTAVYCALAQMPNGARFSMSVEPIAGNQYRVTLTATMQEELK